MKRVLLVEGRADVGELLEDMLRDLGFDVVVATTVSSAIVEARRSDVGFALLEVNIGPSKSYAAADMLSSQGIPFAFINSQGRTGLEHAYWSRPVLVKPFNRQQLREVMDALAVAQ